MAAVCVAHARGTAPVTAPAPLRTPPPRGPAARRARRSLASSERPHAGGLPPRPLRGSRRSWFAGGGRPPCAWTSGTSPSAARERGSTCRSTSPDAARARRRPRRALEGHRRATPAALRAHDRRQRASPSSRPRSASSATTASTPPPSTPSARARARFSAQLGGRRVGVMGLSFAGGLSLIAAGDPRYRRLVRLRRRRRGARRSRARAPLLRDRRGAAPRRDDPAPPRPRLRHAVLEYSHVEDFFPPADVDAARDTPAVAAARGPRRRPRAAPRPCRRPPRLGWTASSPRTRPRLAPELKAEIERLEAPLRRRLPGRAHGAAPRARLSSARRGRHGDPIERSRVARARCPTRAAARRPRERGHRARGARGRHQASSTSSRSCTSWAMCSRRPRARGADHREPRRVRVFRCELRREFLPFCALAEESDSRGPGCAET